MATCLILRPSLGEAVVQVLAQAEQSACDKSKTIRLGWQVNGQRPIATDLPLSVPSDPFSVHANTRTFEMVRNVGLVHHAWNPVLRQEDKPEAEQHVSEILGKRIEYNPRAGDLGSDAGSGHRPRLLNCAVHPLGSIARSGSSSAK